MPLDEAVRGFPYSIDKVWNAVFEALDSLHWPVDRSEPVFHKIKAKTRTSWLAWSSNILIDLSAIDDKNTKVSVIAETHQAIDWGQTGERIDRFFQTLQSQFTLDAHQPKDYAEKLGECPHCGKHLGSMSLDTHLQNEHKELRFLP